MDRLEMTARALAVADGVAPEQLVRWWREPHRITMDLQAVSENEWPVMPAWQCYMVKARNFWGEYERLEAACRAADGSDNLPV